MDRLNIILLSKEESLFTEFTSVLTEKKEFQTTWFNSSGQVWNHLKNNSKNNCVDVAVVSEDLQDCTGLQVVKDLVARNPFINCALASPLPAEDFHEVTEGYGVFMQLPVKPDAQSAKDMIELLEKIYQLTK